MWGRELVRGELSAEVRSACGSPDGVFGSGFFKALVAKLWWAPWAEQGSLLVTSQSFTSPCPPLSSESWLPCQVSVLGEDVDNCLDLHNEANSLVCHSSHWHFLHSWLNLIMPFGQF